MSNYKASQYVPSFLKSAYQGQKSISLTFSDVSGSNFENQDSFAYNPEGAALKSTQQLNVDWSKFENHTFFMSAEAKVNLSFEQIINGFPFDGTKKEVEDFFTGLTGFDKWVFDRFPKFHGQLHFSGTQLSETSPYLGTYITTKDIPGSLFPSLSPDASAKFSVINPKDKKSLSIEMQLKIPEITTDGTQIVLQKINPDKNHGFSIRLNPTMSTSTVETQFDVFSGSLSLTVSKTIDKGKFNHLCFIFDRDSKLYNLKIYNNEASFEQSKDFAQIGDLDIDYSDLLIGSGSQYKTATTILPQQTLSGSMDELRIFHSFRTLDQQKSFAKKSIYSSSDLKLYYKFNEPSSQLSPDANDLVNAIVLDSSGNSLHSYISNFSDILRQDAKLDITSNLIYERDDMSPILFPAQQDVVNLNTELLISASAYDEENPNIITKLIPRHYLLEGAADEGFSSAEENNGSTYGGTGIPGQGRLDNVQIMLSLLYIWAKFFDEIKLFIDCFSSLRTVDYDLNSSVPNNFLFDIAKNYGFFLPPLFTSSNLEQYINGENIDPLIKGNESLSLRSVQHELLRRVLINLPAVIRSKGTQHSIKAFIRSLGIEPDASMRFREYGGPTYRQIQNSRESKSDVALAVGFSNSSLIISPFLSASRIEVGVPKPEGTFVNKESYYPHGISNSINDGLLTSGSWTFESSYKYNLSTVSLSSLTQSLVRFCVTGSGIQNPGIVANLIGYYDENNPKISLYMRPGNNSSAPILSMSLDLPKNSLFNGDIWNVSFGCERNDSIASLISSSYFLRAGVQNDGDISYFSTKTSYFYETLGTGTSLDQNVFRKIDTINNTSVSGTFIAIGSNQYIPEGAASSYRFLNNTSTVPNSETRKTSFDGRALKLKFWSKALSENEWLEHIRNYQSLGVDDPRLNYNYVTTLTGSFERLRIDSLSRQSIREADSQGNISFLDFSENQMHLTGKGFAANTVCAFPETIRYSHLSPYFDEAITNEKIRVRGYNSEKLINRNQWASKSPVYEIVRSESPQDDVRFSIDFSLVDALNKDIINMFSTFDSLENFIGDPNLVFSQDYPDLEKLRNVYFNRLKDKLNFKAFFEFYSWFDNSISTFIEQLLPRKTVFKGSNFVVESHMLERHKHEYYFTQMYLIQDKKKSMSIFDSNL